MAPQEEKLGDAITVKTPLAPLGYVSEKNEKKQLSDKKVARKTTSSGFPKSKPMPSTTRNPDHRSFLDRTPIENAASSEQRPLKRPRLTTEVDKGERGPRHHVPSFAENVSHTSFGMKPAGPERVDVESAAASDFALRPRKGSPASVEVPPRSNSREDRVISSLRPSQKDLPRKHQILNPIKNHGFPTHTVIDLTKDDDPRPQFSQKDRQDPHPNSQNNRQDLGTSSHAHTGLVQPELQQEGKSIEVQMDPNRGVNKSTSPVNASNRNEQNHARKKASSNLVSRQSPKKPPVLAPREVKTLIPPDSYNTQSFQPSMLTSDKQNTTKYPQQPQLTGERPMDVPHQDVVQARRPGLVTESAVEPRTFSPTAANHLSAIHPSINHLPTTLPSCGPASGSTMTSSTLKTNEDSIRKRFDLSEQTKEVVRRIRENRNVPDSGTKVNGTAFDSQVAHLSASISPPDPKQRDGSIFSSQCRESGPSKMRTVVDPLVSNLHTPLLQSNRVTPNTAQSPVALLQESVALPNGTAEPADKPANESTLGANVRDSSWRHIEPEKRRQVLISKHDPVKFDSYIYSKNNEPFRPGSQSFGLPPKLQPPRPTQPPTHFAYIDARIHWTFPRPEKWYREKQKEIRERGTRKSNFGQAAARVAKRKRREAHTMIQFPERVTNNPQWMAALDELDQMAEQYHAQNRIEYKDDKKCEEHRRKMRQKGKERETIVLDSCEDEEMADIPEDKHCSEPDNRSFCYIRRK
ncbi:hypothetical protein K449DRAFT_401307 [Hypoxylon sp. EC38]|nr:hypothetical protein K449DRAFT_401307 [Hypoxylon sp. EC38]